MEPKPKPPTGIDTIHFKCRDFCVQDTAKLRVLPPEHPPRPRGYLWHSTRSPVHGAEAVCKRQGIYVRLCCPFENAPSPDCLIQVTVPTVLSGNNARVVDKATFDRTMTFVQEQVKAIGIDTDIWQAQVTRVDVCRNVPIERPFKKYCSLIRTWKMKHQRKAKEFDNGFEWGNDSFELSCYDKRRLMRIMAKIPEESLVQAPGEEDLIGEHTMRLEYRMLKAKIVRERLRLSKGEESIASISSLYNTLEAWFDEQHKEVMGTECHFKGGASDPTVDFGEWWKMCQNTFRNGDGRPEDAFLAAGYHMMRSALGAERAQQEIEQCLSPYKRKMTKNEKQNMRRRIEALEAQRLMWLPEGLKRAHLYFELWNSIFGGKRMHPL